VLESDAALEDILAAAVDTHVRHDPLLRAMQAASFHDSAVEQTHRGLLERFNHTMTGLMQAGIDEGRVAPGNAEELAVWVPLTGG
jgi:hypothetical protein